MKYINLNNLILLSLLFVGVLFSFISGYGSDEDTLALIGAYESMLGGKNLMASRFTPYPVAELGIGFLSYQFGSWAANLLTFSFYFFQCDFFYYGVDIKFKEKNIVLFLILVLSNPVIYFDNLEPIDYSWALAPLCLGLFFFEKKSIMRLQSFFSVSQLVPEYTFFCF